MRLRGETWTEAGGQRERDVGQLSYATSWRRTAGSLALAAFTAAEQRNVEWLRRIALSLRLAARTPDCRDE